MISTFELSGNTLGVVVRSNMDQAVFREIEELVIAKFKEYKKINLFIEIEKGRDISLKSLMKHIRFQLDNSNRFEKIAVVTDKP